MAEPRVAEVFGPVFNLEVGENVQECELLTYSASNNDWRLADADAEATYAQAIVVSARLNNGDGSTVSACKECLIVDTDTSTFSESGRLYLSTTAGAYTETRPTGVDDLVQVVGEIVNSFGWGAPATDKAMVAHLTIREPHEETHYYPLIHAATGTGIDRDGDFGGVGLLAENDEVSATGVVPKNAIATVAAQLFWTGTGVALDTSDTYTIDVTGGVDDETTSANADGNAAAALTVAANDIASADVIGAFTDATIGFEPGAVLGIMIKKAAEGTGGDDPIMLGVAVTYECV